MAFKVVDAEALDNNLKSVADAIRAKGGTNESLAFPSGFTDAIANIKTGDGAKEEQEKTLDVVENGDYDIFPDSGKVLSKATVNVEVPDKYDDGYSEGYDDGVASVKFQTKAITENGEYTPDNGYSGFSKVNVNVPVPLGKEEQEKTVDITENGTTEVTPDEGKVLSKVNVNVDVPIPDGYIKPSGTKEITENGTHDVTEYSAVNVGVSSSGGETTENVGLLVTQKLENVYSTVSGTLMIYAFYENKGVTKIELPNITRLKERSFFNCSNLATLKLPSLDGYTYQYMASGCTNLVDVDIHKSSHISSYTFQNCKNLEKLDLHKVDTINTNAFSGASKFETLILRTESVPTLSGTNAFSGTKIKENGTGYIYVPSALIGEYRTATNWSSFASQFRAIEDYPDICGGAS